MHLNPLPVLFLEKVRILDSKKNDCSRIVMEFEISQQIVQNAKKNSFIVLIFHGYKKCPSNCLNG